MVHTEIMWFHNILKTNHVCKNNQGPRPRRVDVMMFEKFLSNQKKISNHLSSTNPSKTSMVHFVRTSFFSLPKTKPAMPSSRGIVVDVSPDPSTILLEGALLVTRMQSPLPAHGFPERDRSPSWFKRHQGLTQPVSRNFSSCAAKENEPKIVWGLGKTPEHFCKITPSEAKEERQQPHLPANKPMNPYQLPKKQPNQPKTRKNQTNTNQ